MTCKYDSCTLSPDKKHCWHPNSIGGDYCCWCSTIKGNAFTKTEPWVSPPQTPWITYPPGTVWPPGTVYCLNVGPQPIAGSNTPGVPGKTGDFLTEEAHHG
jgi:hypothetical protein